MSAPKDSRKTPAPADEERRPHWAKRRTGTCNSPQDIPCYFHDAGYCRAVHKCGARNRKKAASA